MLALLEAAAIVNPVAAGWGEVPEATAGAVPAVVGRDAHPRPRRGGRRHLRLGPGAPPRLAHVCTLHPSPLCAGGLAAKCNKSRHGSAVPSPSLTLSTRNPETSLGTWYGIWDGTC